MIVVGSCYFLFTLLIPYDPNIDFVFPLRIVNGESHIYCDVLIYVASSALGNDLPRNDPSPLFGNLSDNLLDNN